VTRTSKLVPFVLLGGAAFALIAIAVSGIALHRQHEREQALALTLEWTRLAPWPKQAHDLDVTSECSAFSRHFALPSARHQR
jgi:hypothetical protein